jgi:xylulokinase
MIADLFGVPIERTNVPDSGTLGCAILAGVGVGMFTSVKSACEKRIQKADTHIPRIEITKKYLSYYEIFHSLYPALKSSFDKISRIKE